MYWCRGSSHTICHHNKQPLGHTLSVSVMCICQLQYQSVFQSPNLIGRVRIWKVLGDGSLAASRCKPLPYNVDKGQKSTIKCNQSVWSTVKATWMGAATWATVGLQFVVIAKAQSKVNSQVLWVTYQSMKWADQVFLCYCAWDYVDSLVVGFGGIYHKLCHIAPLTWCTQGNRRTTQQYCTVLPQTGVVCMLRWLVIVKHLFYPKRSPKRHQHQETVWESQ